MHLSDVMSHAGLSGYAIVAMLLFMAAFVAIVVWIFRPGRRREMDELSRLPLEDDVPPASPTSADAARTRPADGGASR